MLSPVQYASLAELIKELSRHVHYIDEHYDLEEVNNIHIKNTKHMFVQCIAFLTIYQNSVDSLLDIKRGLDMISEIIIKPDGMIQ